MATVGATVSGPVTGGTKGQPFSLPVADLAARGYVAEEFFLDGTATSYAPAPGAAWDANGRWDAVAADSAGYRTRILVVRPVDPAAANGTAVVQWLNVTSGHELGTADDDELLSGYVWVGVSAQKVGIDGFPGDAPPYRGRQLQIPALRAWDEERYGTLVHPGDRFSYDMFSQAGAAVRSGEVTGGVPVERVVATGASQSAARLTTYIGAVHAHAQVYDAFMPTISAGWGTPLDDAQPGIPRTEADRRGLSARPRDDLVEPVMVVNSELETLMMARLRGPDTDRFRFWEVAGTPHTLPLVPSPEPRPEGRVDNLLSYRPVLSSAYRAMHGWLVDGTAPPTFPTIELVDADTIARDEHGNARGGVRLPDLEAPVAEYHGRDDDSPGMLMLYGWKRPFTRDELGSLYPSRAAYVDAYRHATDELVAAGGLRPEDVSDRYAEAETTAAGLDL